VAAGRAGLLEWLCTPAVRFGGAACACSSCALSSGLRVVVMYPYAACVTFRICWVVMHYVVLLCWLQVCGGVPHV
jgi:hypothetical protein